MICGRCAFVSGSNTEEIESRRVVAHRPHFRQALHGGRSKRRRYGEKFADSA
jgi:hypothetical protein